MFGAWGGGIHFLYGEVYIFLAVLLNASPRVYFWIQILEKKASHSLCFWIHIYEEKKTSPRMYFWIHICQCLPGAWVDPGRGLTLANFLHPTPGRGLTPANIFAPDTGRGLTPAKKSDSNPGRGLTRLIFVTLPPAGVLPWPAFMTPTPAGADPGRGQPRRGRGFPGPYPRHLKTLINSNASEEQTYGFVSSGALC